MFISPGAHLSSPIDTSTHYEGKKFDSESETAPMNILNNLGTNSWSQGLGGLGGLGLMGGLGNMGMMGLPPQLMQMMQMVLGMTGGGLPQGMLGGLGGNNGGAMMPMGMGSFGAGGGLAGGFANLANSLGGFLGGLGGGAGFGGGSGGSGLGGLFGGGGGGSSNGGGGGFNWGGGNSGGSRAGGAVGGGDTYVPSGSAAFGAGGALAGGGQGSAAVAWAQSQLGVSESSNPGAVRGYSNGAWQPWCADFVSKAFENSGGSPFGHQSSVQGILNWGKENGRFISASTAAANPDGLRVGDVAVWKQNGKSHVGLVSGINPDGTFTTIEGNTSDKVAYRNHSFDDRGLTGFVRAVEDNAPAGAKTAEVSGSNVASGSKSSNVDTAKSAGDADKGTGDAVSSSESGSQSSKSSSKLESGSTSTSPSDKTSSSDKSSSKASSSASSSESSSKSSSKSSSSDSSSSSKSKN